MIAPFTAQPRVYYQPGQEKRERIPMDLYIDLIQYRGADQEVQERDDVQSVGDLSAAASFASDSAEGGGADDSTAGGPSVQSASTESTALPAAAKKHIRRTVAEMTKETDYEYKTPQYVPPQRHRASQLWQRFVSGPFVEWRRRKAADRRHPVLRYYEQRVVHFEAQRLADAAQEMEEHAMMVQKAAKRLTKLRAAHTRVRSIQEKITDQHIEETRRRDQQHERSEYNMFYFPKWAAEGKQRAEADEQRAQATHELACVTSAEQAEEDRITAARQFERDFFEDDCEETQRVQQIMRRAGVIPGVNAPEALPCNSHARVTDRSELVEAKQTQNKKGKSVRIADGGGASDFDRHQHLLKGMGLKKAAPPISRKTKELFLNLNGSVDFTVNPRHKGRMPWHNAGGKADGGGTMTVFDVDLSLYREVQVLRCERLGERGALCLAAEFVRGACPNMTTLNLNRCQITTRGFGRLLTGVRLARLDNLVSLYLRGNQLGARSVEYIHSALEKGALSNVTLLDLRENELAVQGAHALATMFFSGIVVTLRDIRVQRNNFGDEGFAHIVNVMRSIHDVKCPQVVSLRVGENNASVAVVEEFAPYPSYIQP